MLIVWVTPVGATSALARPGAVIASKATAAVAARTRCFFNGFLSKVVGKLQGIGRPGRVQALARADCGSLVAFPVMPSFLHTCYRIGEIERSVAFYSKLGFEEVRRMPIGDEAINVFMGMPDEDHPRLELTYNHGVSDYEHGTGYN